MLMLGILVASQGSLDATPVTADSLLEELSREPPDTQKLSIYSRLFTLHRGDDPDLARTYAETALQLAEEGQYNYYIGHFNNQLGIHYKRKGEVSTALEYYFKALKHFEALNDTNYHATILNNIGNIFIRLKNLEKGEEFLNQALDIRKKVGNKKAMADTYNNLGVLYRMMEDYEKAIASYHESYTIDSLMGNRIGMAESLNNMAAVYYYKDQPLVAIDKFREAAVIFHEEKDIHGSLTCYNNIAEMYHMLSQFDKCLKNLEQSYVLAKQIDSKDGLLAIYTIKASVYAQLNDYKKAFAFQEKMALLKDSLLNEENSRLIAEMQTKYESEKKEKEIELLTKDKEIQQKELNRQKIVRNSFIGGFMLILILIGVIYNRYQLKQKANQKLQSAYDIIESKNKDITASINYAQRIQQAILPDLQEIKTYLPESFVLYKPKDIVSGDFYWFSALNDPGTDNRDKAQLLIAAADCTGHGVPGAFMSMIGTSLLNEIVNEKGITKPASILDQLKAGIITSLKQTGQNSGSKDGMDIALCKLDLGSLELQYAGAFNPLYLVRKDPEQGQHGIPEPSIQNTSSHSITQQEQAREQIASPATSQPFHREPYTLTEVKADRQPLGIYIQKKERSFTNHSIQLMPGDTLYLFSDGFADQFGGQQGRKFTYKRFRETLLSIQDKPMERQLEYLNQTFDNWTQASNQLDDICVIGFRV